MTDTSSTSLKPLDDAYSAIEACVAIVGSLAMDAERGLEHGDSFSIVADFADLRQLRNAAVLATNNNRRVVHAARRASIDLGSQLPRSGMIVEASALELGSSIALDVLRGIDDYVDRLPDDPAQAAGVPSELVERCKAAITGARLGSTHKYERLTAKIQREYELAKEYFRKADDVDPEPQTWVFHPGGYSFHGTAVSLDGKLLKLLQVLVKAPRPVRLDRLQAGAWEQDDAPTKSAVQSHLTRLRQHLEERWELGNEVVIRAVNHGPDLAYEFDHATFNGFARR